MGPKVSRLNNAGQPSLTQPGLDILGGLTRGIGGGGTGTPMQQQGNNVSAGMNQPSPLAGGAGGVSGGNTLFGNMQGMFGSPMSPGVSNTLQQFASGPNPGQGVVNAYAPIFQRNLAQAMDTGPRFSSGNDMLRTQAMNDYNMFSQQALMGGQQQQIGAALGLGGLQNQAQLPMMQQLLQTLFAGGGMNSGPIYNVSPGFGQQMMGLAGTLGGAALGGGMGGLGGLFGGGGGQQGLMPGGSAGVPTPGSIQNMMGAFGYGGQG